MKYLQFLAAVLAIAPSALATPQPRASLADTNPYQGVTPYANKGYAKKLEETIKTFIAADDHLNAGRTRTVQKTATFAWVSKSADVRTSSATFHSLVLISIVTQIVNIKPLIKEALQAQRRTRKKQLVQVVVYNLPDRDCSAKASAGEFDLADDGLNKYKAYIDGQLLTRFARCGQMLI